MAKQAVLILEPAIQSWLMLKRDISFKSEILLMKAF